MRKYELFSLLLAIYVAPHLSALVAAECIAGVLAIWWVLD